MRNWNLLEWKRRTDRHRAISDLGEWGERSKRDSHGFLDLSLAFFFIHFSPLSILSHPKIRWQSGNNLKVADSHRHFKGNFWIWRKSGSMVFRRKWQAMDVYILRTVWPRPMINVVPQYKHWDGLFVRLEQRTILVKVFQSEYCPLDG